jgi:hypothetical protein
MPKHLFTVGNKLGKGRPKGSKNKPFMAETLRTPPAARLRELMSRMTADLGGPGNLTEAERQLIRRSATIALACEEMETKAAAGEPFDLTTYSTATGHLGRTLRLLGLKRLPREDVPSLRQYLDAARQENGTFGVEEDQIETVGNS